MTNDFSGFGAFAEELDDWREELATARRTLTSEVDRAVEGTARDAFDQSQRDVPVDTGDLKQSGRVFKRADGVWVIEYSADHSVVVEEGSAPHVIEPRDADALRFETETGEVVYTMRVEHPGTEPNPYLGPAIDAQRAELPERLFAAVEHALTQAFR